MKKNIVIIHYNTPYLTECLVKSINLFVKDAIIYIFDNSDKLPFTKKFNNVTILDNTKGDIINFDKWLENYPNKTKSNGKVNKWGSAKHCYSVEKCMEILGENFVLLDSDVLLKRDISNLFKENTIYIGDTVFQPKSSVKRILPFICFINVDLCKKNSVHYFDDRYMHGLYNIKKNSAADSYDTGAGFYMNANKFYHEDIKVDNYILHYGHGSWDKKGYKQKYTDKMWAMKNKKYWSDEKNKKVIYTCITGDYDSIIEPKIISEGFDYICFTDNNQMKSDVWDIRPLPKETDGLSQVKKQRYVKVNPHLLLKDYDISIWADGNVEIVGDLNEFIKEHDKNDCSVFVPTHPSRKCIYAEERAVVSMKKDKKSNTEAQIKRYEEENYPKNNGLLQSNILLRKHNDEGCIKLMNKWWDEIKNGSHRDQLSFNYASWKTPDVKVTYLDKKISESKWFKWHKTHNKPKKTKIQAVAAQPVKQKKSISELRAEFEAILNKRRKYTTNDINLYSV